MGKEDFGGVVRAAIKHLRGRRAPERRPLPSLTTTADRAVSEGCFGFQGSLSFLPLPDPALLLPSSGLPAAGGVVSLGLGPWGSWYKGLMGRRLEKKAGGYLCPQMGDLYCLILYHHLYGIIGWTSCYVFFSNPP